LGGDHQDRRIRSDLARCGEHLPSVEFREPDVEHDQVGLFDEDRIQA
jgi:hypothetical protein